MLIKEHCKLARSAVLFGICLYRALTKNNAPEIWLSVPCTRHMALINATGQSASDRQLAVTFCPAHVLLPRRLLLQLQGTIAFTRNNAPCKRAVTHSDVSLHCAESIVLYTMHCLEYVCVELWQRKVHLTYGYQSHVPDIGL